jgi:hypothetical protein
MIEYRLRDKNGIDFSLNGAVPAIPDDPAGAALRNNSAWTGWTPSNCTLTITSGILRQTATTIDPYITLSGLSIPGSTYRKVYIRFRQIAGALGSHIGIRATDNTIYKNALYTPAGLGVWQTLAIDMSSPDIGAWLGATITNLRLDLPDNAPDTSCVMEISDLYVGTGAYLPFTVRALKKSTTLSGGATKFSSSIVERSSGHGSLKFGDARIAASEITIISQATFETDAEYLACFNALAAALLSTKWLIDATNSRRTEVFCSGLSDDHDAGCEKRSIEFEITLTQLTPYWEDLTATTVTGSASASVATEIPIADAGSIEVDPIITLSSAASCASIAIECLTTSEGIELDDPQFGDDGTIPLIIDVSAGTVMLGSESREIYIAEGTGFFRLPAGASTLRVIASAAVTISISYRKRSYR